MHNQLRISVGQYSDKGRKGINQDFHGAYMPRDRLLGFKGCAVAVADGISSSDVGREASEAAVTGFFEDYFSTPETWSVKKSAQRVLTALNSWLYAQTRQSRYQYDMDRGYVCTLSAIIIKSTTAHIFHVGDSRIYRFSDNTLEQLTNDHRILISAHESYLGSALGADQKVDIEYHALAVEEGDVFVLATDGVYEYTDSNYLANVIAEYASDPSAAAEVIAAEAFARGSGDNLTVQLVRIEELPIPEAGEHYRQRAELPFPPELKSRMSLDGYRLIRNVHASSRSHVWLAEDEDTGELVAIKTLSTEMQNDPEQVERFLTEEWIARRINSVYVARALPPARRRHYLYTVTEFIEGRSLTQWMRDNPKPDLESVRGIVEQIARGLRAFHRMEMVHQDLRPDNVMIDDTGTVKLIDFGSTLVAGLVDSVEHNRRSHRLGTAQYSAPEYFLGEGGSNRSDIYSLGAITYRMLTGGLPYGVHAARARTRLDQRRLKYTPVLHFNRDLPAWIDGPLKKALQPDPNRRYPALSEFIYDLRHPRREFFDRPRPPLAERDPVRFWQGVSLILAVAVVIMAILTFR